MPGLLNLTVGTSDCELSVLGTLLHYWSLSPGPPLPPHCCLGQTLPLEGVRELGWSWGATWGLPHTHCLALAWTWDHHPVGQLQGWLSPGTQAAASFLGREPLIRACSLILSPFLEKIPQAQSRDPGGAGPGHWAQPSWHQADAPAESSHPAAIHK